MKINWTKTGDYLELVPCHEEFARYWVEQINGDFTLSNNLLSPSCYNDLLLHIESINNVLVSKFGVNSLDKFKTANLFNQEVLNDLHRTWVLLGIDYPKLVVALRALNEQYYVDWNQINKKLHSIETDFVFEYTLKQYWQIDNPFGIDILNFNKSQISIMFSQRGRTTYDKWLNFDYNIDDRDTNNFLQIGSEILIDLNRELTLDAPENYKQFCTDNNLPVIGNRLNLANFNDYENKLSEIREVFYRNLQHKNNTTKFTI